MIHIFGCKWFVMRYLLLFFLMLVGCDTKDHTPLPGTRFSFSSLNENLVVDGSLKSKFIKVGEISVNKSWKQAGGNLAHAMPPLKLSTKPSMLWKKNIGEGASEDHRLISNVVVDNNLVVAMDAVGNLIVVKQGSGEEVWRCDITLLDNHEKGESLSGGVCTNNDVVYITTSLGNVVALNQKDGKMLWKKSLNTPIRSSPSADNKRIYVVTVSNETYVLDAKTGHELWTHSGIAESASLLGGASPAVGDGFVISTYSSGEVYVFDVKNGQILHYEMLIPSIRSDTVSSIPHIYAHPVISQNCMYAISHGGRMICTNLKTGEKKWHKEIASTQTTVVVGDFIFILTNTNEVLCLDKDQGRIKWFISLPSLKNDEEKQPIFWYGPVAINNTLALSGSNGEIRFLNIHDGTVIHSIYVDNVSFPLSPIVANEILHVLDNNGYLYAWK